LTHEDKPPKNFSSQGKTFTRIKEQELKMNTLSKCSFFVLFLTAMANAAVIHIPEDESTIQAGIDAAVNGDTVLVQPGTYVENIEIDGKNITIGSLTLTTGDTNYISETIIDGNGDESVVIFEYAEDSTGVLNGFTITNGSAENRGGGIYCYHSKLSIINIVMNGNAAFSGGGICCYHSDLDVYNVTIYENTVRSFGGGIDCRYSNMNLSKVTVYGNTSERTGGGIDCYDSNMNLSNVTICANTGGGMNCENSNLNLSNVNIRGNTIGEYSKGGGICCKNSDLNLSNVTISENTADEGGGIYFDSKSSATFDTEHRCNIFSNHANSGNDLWSDISPAINVVVDTFTVMIPTDYYAMPSYNFIFDILHAKIEQIGNDVYVSPNGNDANSGQSSSKPLRTISRAFKVLSADSLHPNTIHLADGVYSPSENGEHFPIQMLSYVSLSGESKNSVILNAENQDRVIFLDDNRETSIKNLTITGGHSVSGGGIRCIGTTLDLVNVNITGNRATYGGGGGILCVVSTLSFENVTISENRADYFGGGIFCDESTLFFDNENRSNIYFNYAGLGNDLYNSHYLSTTPVAIIVDTFTVMNPTNYHAYSTEEFTFDILNSKIEQSDSDLYVSPDGDDTNSGQSPSEPLKTISLSLSKILTDSLHPRTIHLADGVYSPSTNGERFPLDMVSHVSLSGQSHGNVILDAEEQSGIMYLENDQEITMKNLIITGGYVETTEVIFLYHSTLNLSNITITENTTTRALILCYDSKLRMANSIFWDTSPKNIYTDENDYPCSITVLNSNIQGGRDAVTVADSVSLNWLDGNIDSDPLFVDPGNGDFSLQEDSPCIDAGTVFFVLENDTLVNIDTTGYSGSAPDIGAVESPYTSGIINPYQTLPNTFALYHNYPNPFNPSTEISFTLPKNEKATLKIYDLLGREVQTLVNGYKKAGSYHVTFDGSNLPSGIYLYRLETPSFVQIHKMILMK
jgi:hypothetical protein